MASKKRSNRLNLTFSKNQLISWKNGMTRERDFSLQITTSSSSLTTWIKSRLFWRSWPKMKSTETMKNISFTSCFLGLLSTWVNLWTPCKTNWKKSNNSLWIVSIRLFLSNPKASTRLWWCWLSSPYFCSLSSWSPAYSVWTSKFLWQLGGPTKKVSLTQMKTLIIYILGSMSIPWCPSI